MPIDTLKAARRLQEEDTFDEDQAERIAEVMSDFGAASATKEDLNELEERLTQRIELSEERLGQKVEGVRSELTRTIVASVAAVGAVLTVVIPLVI